MVADILPEEKRTQGYGLWRVVTNLAITFGPLIGGFVVGRASYVTLFIGDGISSLITAGIVLARLPETKPDSGEGELAQSKSLWESFKGYREVVRDTMFISLILTVALMNTVYIQMHSTLPVWLTNINGYPANTFGNLLAMNAGMVVLFQFWVARRVSKRQPFLVMALGAALYGIGFGMYGFVDGLLLFAAAMVVITIGEMVFMPVFQATIAKMAPEDMRGRYMGFATLIWAIPSGIGPSLAGLVVDNYDPNWVWYGAVMLSLIAALGYLSLHARSKKRLAAAPSSLAESAAD
jgi:MFS family permease